MSNPDHSNPNSHEHSMPVFPAPRVWGLGWQGEAWAGTPHQHSTLDFDTNVPDTTIIIIDNTQPPPDARTVS